MYLDSWLGVIGGLYFGLRKEYKPSMTTNITATSKSWNVPNIIESAFVQEDKLEDGLPTFIKQSFENPFVTISYPPFANTYFY